MQWLLCKNEKRKAVNRIRLVVKEIENQEEGGGVGAKEREGLALWVPGRTICGLCWMTPLSGASFPKGFIRVTTCCTSHRSILLL
jgi:hypothetical protein